MLGDILLNGRNLAVVPERIVGFTETTLGNPPRIRDGSGIILATQLASDFYKAGLLRRRSG